jgi:CheY-like chemotaxis protein
VKVLVVDDSRAVRTRLAEMIREVAGVADVSEAADAAGALAQLHRVRPHLVVLDVHLPDESGLQLLPKLRANHGGELPMIVVLTNDASEYHRRECVARGADAFFDKSSEFDQVVALVAKRIVAMRGKDL